MKAFLLALALAAPPAASAAEGPIKMSGFLRSRTSESIRPQASEEWSYNITMLAPEGSRVKPGDVVARLEGERLKQRLADEQNRLLEERVKSDAKINEIKAQIESQQKALADEESALELLLAGRGDDATAAWLTPARTRLTEELDIESKRLKRDLSREKLARRERLLEVVVKSKAKATEAAEMRVEKFKDAIAAAERKAGTEGIVVYKRSAHDRRKVRVGGQAHRGTEVIAIVDDRALFIEAYLRESDWPRAAAAFAAKAPVRVKVLGRKEVTVAGTLARVSKVVLRAGDWDRSLPASHPLFSTRVFRCEIELDAIPDEARPEGDVEIELDAT